MCDSVWQAAAGGRSSTDGSPPGDGHTLQSLLEPAKYCKINNTSQG